MNSCFYGEYNKDFDDIVQYWNSKKMITKNIGKVGGNSSEEYFTQRYLNDVSEHLFKVPFDSAFKFNKGEVNRFKLEIDNIERNYLSKKIGAFRKNFYVSDAIANYSPVTRMFYNKVNNAINYERNHLDQYLTMTNDVVSNIRKALITKSGMTKKQAKEYLKEMADLENKILRAEAKDGASAEVENNILLERYNHLYEKNGEGVVKDYIDLMEMPKAEYKKASKNRDELMGRVYDENVLKAVDSSRILLDSMGKVLINGLDRMTNVVEMMYDSPLMPKTGRNYIERINKAKKAVREGIEDGGYLPHYLIDNIVETNYKMRQLLESKNSLTRESRIDELTGKVELMTQIPDQSRGRNVLLNNTWSKNPFHILTQYSKDVIAFNKINYIQEAYLPAIRRFQKDDSNPEFMRSMRDFINDTFQVSTMGLMERPNVVNGLVRGIMAAETLKSMGLSVTGAIRNGASGIYFFVENGILAAKKSIELYNRNDYKKMLSEIEAEQGFAFAEAGRELVTEGLIPSTVNQTDIVFDPIKQKISYRDRGVLKTLDPIIDKTVGASLVFHRATENFTRKWMFRIAWIQAYENLKGKNIVDPRKNKSGEETYDIATTNKLKKMATETALKTVNKYAFEYAAHAKARAVGGTAPMGKLGPDGLPKMSGRDYATALGEVTFQFMHYPMSFMNLQSKILKGAKDAALSKQWDAPEIKQALRLAGIYMTVGALSVMTNLDFTNLLENDTVERVRDLSEYLTSDEKELKDKKRGLINDFTGPVVGDMLYALNMMQMYKMPEENWQKMLTGYIDYYEEEGFDNTKWSSFEDWQEKRHFWNKMNVELARWMTKSLPAIRDGRGLDVVRHELGLYPRAHLKEKRTHWNKRIERSLGFKPFTGGIKGKDNSADAKDNLLKLIDEIKVKGY
jgi:polyhydroxyalkanoate synthesis regulator phasin